jgi:hypothetical protein
MLVGEEGTTSLDQKICFPTKKMRASPSSASLEIVRDKETLHQKERIRMNSKYHILCIFGLGVEQHPIYLYRVIARTSRGPLTRYHLNLILPAGRQTFVISFGS